ncbi:hypothetical protein [Metabacillus sp. 84]|uniref:hypothetical protein n=1 Tax=unclassified Metabacillus TaxID=2675274 RepID=UPI003CE7DD83
MFRYVTAILWLSLYVVLTANNHGHYCDPASSEMIEEPAVHGTEWHPSNGLDDWKLHPYIPWHTSR